jgi:hypothetical protein
MDLERPDLDDYEYLAKGLPGIGLLIVWGILRTYGVYLEDMGVGLLIGVTVGSLLISVLVYQLHRCKDRVAQAVVDVGNPRLPVGFAVAVGIYLLGVLISSACVELVVPPVQASDSGTIALSLIAGAFLPWCVLLWPMQEIRDRADVLYRERDKVKFGKPAAEEEPEETVNV